MPQGDELLDGTVAENIARFGRIDSEAVVRATRLAGVHDMILRLPQGYDTPIGGQTGAALATPADAAQVRAAQVAAAAQGAATSAAAGAAASATAAA
jgi:ABC-type protease/lipase transport system fused ATPase/permease subunit